MAAGEPLIEVADPTRLEIVADFLSEDAVRIPAGAEVLIERWGGEQPLRGRVRRVEPAGRPLRPASCGLLLAARVAITSLRLRPRCSVHRGLFYWP